MLLKQYAKAGGATLLTRFVVVGTGFADIWLLTAILGVGEFGASMLALSVISISTILLTSVIERPAFLRLANLGETEEEEFVTRRVAGAAVIGSVSIGGAIGLACWLAAPWIASAFEMNSLAQWLQWMCVLPIMLAGWTTLASCFQARQRVALSSFGGQGFQATAQTAFLALLFLLGPGPDAAVPAAAVAMSVAAAAPFAYLLWRARIRIVAPMAELGRTEMIYGLRLSALRLLTQTERSLDVLFVGFFGTAEAVAFYTVGSKIAKLLGFGKQAIDSLLVPRIGRVLAEGEARRAHLQHEMRMARAGGFAACLIGLAAVAPASPYLTELLGGYEAAIPFMLLLAAGEVIETGTGTVGLLLAMGGFAKQLLNTAIVATLVFVAVSLALGSELGAVGVAFGVLAGNAVRNGLAVQLASRMIGIHVVTSSTALTLMLVAAMLPVASLLVLELTILVTVVISLAAFALTLLEAFREWKSNIR